MIDWIVAHKIPLGQWAKQGVDWLDDHAQGLFDAIAAGLTGMIEGLSALLLAVNPLILIGAVALFAFWLHRSFGLALFAAGALLLIVNLGYWPAAMETLALVACATLACTLIGVPLGVLAARKPWAYASLRPILDLMQTIPTFVYLIPTLVLFGLGAAPGLISTAIFALPAPIRLTHLGLTSVPAALRETGMAFGASSWQSLIKIELPYAMPAIMAGVTQCIMLSLSMVVIAALVGANGLGKPVVRALNTVNIPMGFEAGAAIVILAILLDRICKAPIRREGPA